MKIFVSYAHKNGAWVWERLVPVLRAAGAELLIDKERFKAGFAVKGQMDALQDQADRHLLCLSSGYVASDYCMHELRRAVALDPGFAKGCIVPVRCDDTALPTEIEKAEPLWVDLRDDRKPDPWKLVLERAEVKLGVAAPTWLDKRDEVVREFTGGSSVNLVCLAKDSGGEELMWGLPEHVLPSLAVVDLSDPLTITRQGLCLRTLEALGMQGVSIPKKPNDLGEFSRHLSSFRRRLNVGYANFDLAATRKEYGNDFFSTLRYLKGEGQLQLVVHSHKPFVNLVPRDHPLSTIDLKQIELK